MHTKTITPRGFPKVNFVDGNDKECNLQISSAIRDEKLLWIGCESIGLKTFGPNGWVSHSDKEALAALNPQGDCLLANTRMHLSQSQVKEILPYLIKFVETGELE